MPYNHTELVGGQLFTDNATTQQHQLGIIVDGFDPTFGAGEFIYLKGVASTVVGSIVNYDAAYQTALHSSSLSLPRPVAVAMAATVANQFGWYQISGQAVVVKANTLSLNVGEAIAVTSGAAVVVASGLILNGATVAAVASAVTASTSVRVMINRPHDTSDVS